MLLFLPIIHKTHFLYHITSRNNTPEKEGEKALHVDTGLVNCFYYHFKETQKIYKLVHVHLT